MDIIRIGVIVQLSSEGMEECRRGTGLGLEYVKRTWNAI